MSLSNLQLCLINIRENTRTSSSHVIANKQQGPRAGETKEESLFKISIHTIVCLTYTQHMTIASISIIYHAKLSHKMIILAMKKFKVANEASKLIKR